MSAFAAACAALVRPNCLAAHQVICFSQCVTRDKTLRKIFQRKMFDEVGHNPQPRSIMQALEQHYNAGGLVALGLL